MACPLRSDRYAMGLSAMRLPHHPGSDWATLDCADGRYTLRGGECNDRCCRVTADLGEQGMTVAKLMYSSTEDKVEAKPIAAAFRSFATC